MNDKKYSEKWLNYKQAEENFVEKRKAFYYSNFDTQLSDLEMALKGDRNDILLALELLKDFTAQYKPLLKALVDIVIDGNEICSSYAIDVVSKYKDTEKEEILYCVNAFLKKGKEDYFNYKNVARLLYVLSYKYELSFFLEKYCSSSEDEDIRELSQSYNED